MITQLRSWFLVSALGLSMAALPALAQTAPAPTQAGATAAPAPAVAPAGTSAALLPPAQVPGKYRTYLEQRYASDKGALEVIQLFARRQTGGALWLGIGAGFIGFVASQTGTTTTSSGTTKVEVTPLGYGLLVGLFGGVGIGKLSRFSNQKLYEALRSNEQQRGWPEYVSKRL